MAQEIERKFLVRDALLPALPAPLQITQGFLARDPVVRVRLTTLPDGARKAYLTVKGRGLLSRAEYEYPIPPEDAESLLRLCARGLAKERYLLGRWEVDRFLDVRAKDGQLLWLAELELASEDEPFERPPWLGDEVTDDPSYANAALAVLDYRNAPIR